ncbi:MAG: tRNA (guanosine(37)-N1)-methyltransferase TrmD [Rickettsiales bacterium]|jgi:tRNA (guanine37-N1)-methyltransferase|nr:tRNA (guanosine(37)-N1)-methyltransferase TrmD [Rickettsiales bacterium]
MDITVFTIFPEIINDFCSKSLLGKSLAKDLWKLKIINPRDYSADKRKKVDDTPFGGTHGLVMRPDVIGRAIEDNCSTKTKIIYPSPRGKKLNQRIIEKLHDSTDKLAIICGRYEGIDERIIEEYSVEELSIGDFVVMGGELPALLLIEGLVRCINGTVGNIESTAEDSFGGNGKNIFNNLLEYPLYTKPRMWKGRKVPEVLLSGNHKEIKKWKILMAENVTKDRRKDIWRKYSKNKEKQL